MKAYNVKLRRKRESKTDYKSRINLLASNKIRVTVRKTLNNHYIQFIKFDVKGDLSLLSSNTKELSKLGWKSHGGNIPSAYLTGYMAGLKALKKGIKEGILDIGPSRSVKGSSYYAAAKGVIDAGFKLNCSEDVIPDEEKITGKNIENYAKMLASDKDKYSRQFGKYLKAGQKPEELSKHFQDIKKKIKEKYL